MMPTKVRSIYIIAAATGPLKIGSAGNVGRRLSTLQTGHPERLGLHACWPHAHASRVEHEVHKRLEKQCVGGEWFNVTRDEAIKAVQEVMKDLHMAGPLFADPDEPSLDVQPVEVGPDTLGLFGDQHRMGYAKPMSGLSVGRQKEWLLRSGVDPRDIFEERDWRAGRELVALFKDVQAQDEVLVWSPALLGTWDEAEEFVADVKKKKANVVFAFPR